MGLVAQAPIDTLFAPMAAMPGPATPAAGTVEGDLFATLLASLTTGIPAETTAGPGAQAGVVPPALSAGEPVDEDDTDDDAMSAAAAALQLLPQLTPILPGPLAGGQAPTGVDPSAEAPVATTDVIAAVAAPTSSSAPPEGDAESVPSSGALTPSAEAVADAARPAITGGEATSAEPAPTTESMEAGPTAPAASTPPAEVDSRAPAESVQPTPAATAQPAARDLPAGSATTPRADSPASPATPATPGRQGAPAVAATPAGPATDVVAANRARRDERKLERAGDDPPAVEAAAAPPPSEQAATASVVRFDGNADNPGHSNGQQDSTSKEGNEPNASVQGIAHAAANSAAGELRTADAAPVADVPQPGPAATAAPEAVEHVGRMIIEKVEQGGGEARLHLRPEALGEVTLQIRTDGDRVHVEIHAERAEAANLLRDHTGDLSQLLGDRGLNLTDVHVDVGWQGPRGQQGEQPSGEQRRPGAEDSSFASLMGLDEPSPAERHNRLRSAYNPDGVMSYRV